MSNEPPASPSVADPAPLGLAGFAHERRFTMGRTATNVGSRRQPPYRSWSV
jgi:hypothetical protein